MLVSARMFPANVLLVPMVAELPTCQKSPLFGPHAALGSKLMMLISELLAVVRVLPI